MKDIVREMLLRLDDVDEWRRKLAMLKLIQAALDIKLDQRQITRKRRAGSGSEANRIVVKAKW